ncbi:hypothetical protein CGRA01v4_08550 [Colletotrichum graminicola]|uniref:Uncharacterized protein n=1 Tax=Colletotrichum graminicola (strain M1.001 / M2 / FGSC 10212) TaxID=645133 RepID=E3QJH2_COLGM|nr:uncharacterized protein GLRG_06154 [Colletotrichum graminicola M1.001]EFQ31010.1 hypothetical protein GLRG_06154 [Colletotrichum graminicola M1.001]WDK17267.1 hypothetical protein CGRA01v4_08550 [Colletotrichum graminicola]
MAYAIARSDPINDRPGQGGMPIDRTTKNFALVEKEVNECKGTFFGEGTPNGLTTIDLSGANRNRAWIRNQAAVFQYLRYTHRPPSTKENVWDKWMRVSNWMDLVLDEFDRNYPWGTHPDEPRRSGANPSLRSFYAYWIDTYLGGIESNAKGWARRAQVEFRQRYGKENGQAATNWLNDAFRANGFADQARMEFPRPAGAASVFGAYGNPAMTLDRDGTAVNLGAPAPL